MIENSLGVELLHERMGFVVSNGSVYGVGS